MSERKGGRRITGADELTEPGVTSVISLSRFV
jgi:hypothetical protein